MFSSFVSHQYCYDYLQSQISVGLVSYSHIPTALIALIFGGYLLSKTRKLPAYILFFLSISFAVWCLLDLGAWFSFLGLQITQFTWSLLEIFGILFFFFAYYFTYSFIKEKDLPFYQKLIGIALLLPMFWFVVGDINLQGYDLLTCESIENNVVTNYVTGVEIFFIFITTFLVVNEYRRVRGALDKKKILLTGAGVGLFLFTFSFTGFLTDIINYFYEWKYSYNIGLYGLFGMPLFLMFLGYLIVKFKAFNLKIFGAQALVASLIAIILSEYFFVTSTTNRVLVLITLLLAAVFGYNLIKSVKKEIESREKIQKLASELFDANKELDAKNIRLQELDKQKTEFVSFATHQLRSPLASMRGNASLILEGDAGPVSDMTKQIVSTIATSAKTLINVVEDYLNISRIELGTMKYNIIDMDFKDLLSDVMGEQKVNIEAKGLTYSVNVDPNTVYKIKADPDKFKQVVMNTIDNSIKYTPKGSITITLSKNAEKGTVVLKIADTGVGIRPDVMPKLFQKFSRSPNASEANIHGTGLGLFIAKEIMNAHGGKIWAESEGEGKGSQFYIELPEAK